MTLTVRELADLVAARVVDPRLSVFRRRPETRPSRGYVVLYFGAGTPTVDGRLGAVLAERDWRFRALCVGYSDDQALLVAQIVSDRLAGWRPEPDNRAAGRITQDDDDPPLLSDGPDGDVRTSTTLTFRYHTTRSPL